MKRIIAASALLILAMPARAQNEFPRLELFAGYSFQTAVTRDQYHPLPKLLRFDQQWFRPDSERGYSGGLSFAFSRNFSKHLGITSTFAWERGRDETMACVIPFATMAWYQQSCLEEQKSGSFQTSIGPRFTSRKGRITHFTHALVGTYLPMGGGGASGAVAGDRYFAMSYGGGMDVALNDRLSIRTFQADYMSGRDDLLARPRLRLQTGIVLTFGRR